jgi:drug/metabolite transporter, DME family
MHDPMLRSTRARLTLLLTAVLFSTGGAAIKAAHLSMMQIAGLRAAVAAVTIAALLHPPLRSFHGSTLLVAAAQAATMALFVASNRLTTAANAIYLQSADPLYVAALSPFVLGERLTRRDLGYLLAFAAGLGLFFVRSEAAQATAPDPALGNLVGVASGVGWACTLVGLRWLAAREAEAAAGGAPRGDAAAAAAILANAVVFCGALPWLDPAGVSARDWLTIGWLGVFQVGMSYVLLTRAVRHVGAIEASLLLLVEPVLNPLWAWLLHGEQPSPWALAGGGVILGTTALRLLRERGDSTADLEPAAVD